MNPIGIQLSNSLHGSQRVKAHHLDSLLEARCKLVNDFICEGIGSVAREAGISYFHFTRARESSRSMTDS